MREGPLLVTGASGFAGRHLADHLEAQGETVARWDRRSLDLLDRDAVRTQVAALRPAAIYHCAGAPHVAESWSDTALVLATNVRATECLLDAVRRAALPCRVLLVGSATVYRRADHPLTEDDPTGPTNPYGLSKLAQEILGRRAQEEDGIQVTLTRSFNHTGPGQRPSFAAPAFARQLALIEAGHGPATLRVGNLDAKRDFLDVRDVARAYRLIMERGRTLVPYNVCSGSARSVAELLDALRSRFRTPVHVEQDPALLRPVDTPLVVGDATRLREDTGWTPTIPFDRMLDDLAAYWRARVQAGTA